jgi:hypothetical protein
MAGPRVLQRGADSLLQQAQPNSRETTRMPGTQRNERNRSADSVPGAAVLDRHFIGGRFVDSHGREVIDVHNPADRVLIGRATLGTKKLRAWSTMYSANVTGAPYSAIVMAFRSSSRSVNASAMR